MSVAVKKLEVLTVFVVASLFANAQTSSLVRYLMLLLIV